MKNLFDYAYKELTNTAIWAWILANEDSTDAELVEVSRRLRQKLGIPTEAKFIHVATNQNIDAKNQLDILATYEILDRKLFILIENKTGKSAGVLEQIKRYILKLQEEGAQHIRPFIFSFDVELDAMREVHQKDGVFTVTIRDMQDIFNQETYINIVLEQYASFLKKKLILVQKMTEHKGRKSGEMGYEYWQDISSRKGVEDLLFFYVEKAEGIQSCETRFNKNNSVHLQFKNEGALVSARPKESNIVKGLKIGYSVTNLGHRLDAAYLPSSFEDDKILQPNIPTGNEWRFGFFNNREAIAQFLSFFDRL